MDWSLLAAWIAPFNSLWADAASFVPRLVAAVFSLLVGLMLARLGRRITRGIGRLLKLDAKLGQLWLFRFWSRERADSPPSEIIARFVYFCLTFLVMLLTIRVLDVGIGQTILGALAGLAPRMFSFLLIIFLGALLAMFFSVIAQLVLARSGIQHPNFWGKAIAWGTFGVAVVFSLEQLGVVGSLLTVVVLIGLGAAGLGAAVAFGLGCKDLAREFLIELIKGDKKEQ